MAEEKVKLDFDTLAGLENEEIIVKGLNIKLRPYLTTGEMIYLINEYVTTYFGENRDFAVDILEWNPILAELNLKNLLIQMLTNIDVEDLNENIYYNPFFWQMFEDKVSNYDEFIFLLGMVVSDIKKQIERKSSFGNIEELLENGLANLSDVSPEQIAELQKNSISLAKQLEENSIISDMQRGKI